MPTSNFNPLTGEFETTQQDALQAEMDRGREARVHRLVEQAKLREEASRALQRPTNMVQLGLRMMAGGCLLMISLPLLLAMLLLIAALLSS